MRLRRLTVSWLLVLATLAAIVPAAALAGGPSAGDNQYVDPLAGGQSSGSKHKPKPSSSPSAPSSPAPSSSTPSSTPVPTPIATATTTSATTAAASSTKKDPSSSSKLPRTGFDAWLAAAFGIGLLAAGVTLRRRPGASRPY